MLDQDEIQAEHKGAPQPGRAMPAGNAPAQGINQQIRDTVENLKLKLENLRLYLSWHGNR